MAMVVTVLEKDGLRDIRFPSGARMVVDNGIVRVKTANGATDLGAVNLERFLCAVEEDALDR